MKNRFASILFNFFILCSLSAMVISCGVTQLPVNYYTSWEQQFKEYTCNKKENLKLDSFRILNNQWGYYKVKNDIFSICIGKNKNAFGWKWNMPKKSFGIIAYPEVHYGIAPWRAVKNKAFKQISDISTFNVFYDTELVSTQKKYNLSLDFWVMKTDSIFPQNIHSEIMIWEDYNKFTPNGKRIAEVSTSEGKYFLYVGKVVRKKMQLEWKYIAFIREEKRTSGKIPVKELFNYLTQNYIIPPQSYLTAIEMGTELSNSDGYIIFKDYKIDLR